MSEGTFPHDPPRARDDVAYLRFDSVTEPGTRCHRSLINHFVTVDERFISSTDNRPWWRVKRPVPCPFCRSHLPFFPEADLQRVAGTPPAAEVAESETSWADTQPMGLELATQEL